MRDFTVERDAKRQSEAISQAKVRARCFELEGVLERAEWALERLAARKAGEGRCWCLDRPEPLEAHAPTCVSIGETLAAVRKARAGR